MLTLDTIALLAIVPSAISCRVRGHIDGIYVSMFHYFATLVIPLLPIINYILLSIVPEGLHVVDGEPRASAAPVAKLKEQNSYNLLLMTLSAMPGFKRGKLPELCAAITDQEPIPSGHRCKTPWYACLNEIVDAGRPGTSPKYPGSRPVACP